VSGTLGLSLNSQWFEKLCSFSAVKSPASGELVQIFVPNGSLIEDLYDPVGLIAKCTHPKRIGGVCSTCGDVCRC
jgi:hypothetical protein